MTRVTLTDANLKNLKFKKQVYELADAGAPGLRIRVYPTKRVVFRWHRPVLDPASGKRRQKIITLGEYPGISLAEARQQLEQRKEAHKAALMYGDGEIVEKVETVKDLAELFRKRRLSQRKRPEEGWRIIERDLLPRLGKRKLGTVTAPIVGQVVSAKAKNAPVHAKKALQLAKQLFGFGEALGYLRSNPAGSLRAEDLGIEPFTPGSRYLASDEIKRFYRVLDVSDRMSEQTKLAFKILLLTAVRTGELIQARWEHLDLDAGTWIIPPENQKLTPRQLRHAKDFMIPLPEQAVKLFEQLKECAGESEFVMASPDSDSGHYDSKALGRALRRLLHRKVEVDGEKSPLLDVDYFSPHDLRRTCRTHLTDTLDVQPHIAEKVLNHSLGTLERIYDKGELLKQRKEALLRWADWIDRVTNESFNVRELRE